MMTFDEFEKFFQEEINAIDTIITQEMESAATLCVAEIKARTPVKTGFLRRSMTHDEVKKLNGSYSVNVGSALSYAQAVEEGHRQEVGKYIPALGKRLKKPFVPGKHMIRDSVTIYQDKLEKNIKARIENEVFK